MASRTRKEFRGRDYQRIANLAKALQMVRAMDLERANYNADPKNEDKPSRKLFAAWNKVSTAMNTMQKRLEAIAELKLGMEDPGIE